MVEFIQPYRQVQATHQISELFQVVDMSDTAKFFLSEVNRHPDITRYLRCVLQLFLGIESILGDKLADIKES